MFRKLVSQLNFSSSLMSEIGAYAERLKQEEALRGISTVVMLIAVIVTSLMFMFPPSSTNTAHANDLLRGGVTSKHEFMQKYNSDEQHLRRILSAIGISRSDIHNASQTTIDQTAFSYSTGRVPSNTSETTERAYTYAKSSDTTGEIYAHTIKPFHLPVAALSDAIVGSSQATGKFAVLLTSGNVLMEKLPSGDTHTYDCVETDKATDSDTCKDPFTYTKTVQNATTHTDAATPGHVAHASDRLIYTLTAKNTSDKPAELRLTDNLSDIREYADIVDTDGGVIDEESDSVSWFAPVVSPNEAYTRTLTIRVKPHVAATAQGMSNPASYDCMMTNNLIDTSTAILVACPAVKQIELVSRTLPTVPVAVSFYSSLVLFVLTTFLFYRSRRLREEIRLIRKDINAGTLL